MALGYPSHDNVTRMHKLFPKVAREPLSPPLLHQSWAQRCNVLLTVTKTRTYERLSGFDLAPNQLSWKKRFVDVLRVFNVIGLWSANTLTDESTMKCGGLLIWCSYRVNGLHLYGECYKMQETFYARKKHLKQKLSMHINISKQDSTQTEHDSNLLKSLIETILSRGTLGCRFVAFMHASRSSSADGWVAFVNSSFQGQELTLIFNFLRQ